MGVGRPGLSAVVRKRCAVSGAGAGGGGDGDEMSWALMQKSMGQDEIEARAWCERMRCFNDLFIRRNILQKSVRNYQNMAVCRRSNVQSSNYNLKGLKFRHAHGDGEVRAGMNRATARRTTWTLPTAASAARSPSTMKSNAPWQRAPRDAGATVRCNACASASP